ncbi:DNA polymerase [Methyloprofundus sedimenti]|uniref:Type-4 uracil-DNA glycosylase n=1 Tax=Methyloprofundus sedimenti TaxID=1420851 RepID=A0A1V8M0S0_9GAMM|nr:uracil-DNA glycosylase [Methyloprofundus sedimenti]OQK15102.1 DNA polymerase [Methyloprofundus sedimenti]
MDNTTRLQYLSAMGIDVWVPRIIAENTEIEAMASDAAKDSWSSLHTEMRACQQCDLCQTRQQVVIGAGNQHADYMWITEAPGLEEEQQGLPFADDSAELLTEMLRAMQLSREQVYITHIVKCRPPEDRDPKAQELVACDAFLQRQIALIQPKVLIAVGRIAAHKLLQSKAPLADLRGIEHQFSGVPLITMYHPAYLLRSLTEKSKAWQDMQMALTLLNKYKK